MKNLVCGIFFCITIGITIVSCEGERIGTIHPEDKKISRIDVNPTISYLTFNNGKYVISFNSRLEKNTLSAYLQIDNNSIDTMQISVASEDYKYRTFIKIEEKASYFKKTFSFAELKDIEASYIEFIESTIDELSENEYNYISLDLMYYYKSVLNTAIRNYSDTRCECTPTPSYFVDKTKFWCQEEFTFTASKFKAYFSDNENEVIAMKGGKVYYDYIMALPASIEKITYLELFELQYKKSEFRDYLKFSANRNEISLSGCWLGRGSDLGCCGNYGGCCWYSHLLCLVHDIECYSCDHWHCGPACEPEK